MRSQLWNCAGRVLKGIVAATVLCNCVCASQESGAATGDAQLDSLLNLTVSSASKYAQTMSDAPSSVTVITAEEIRLFGFRTIEDVLRTVPGFYVSDDHDYGYVGVRGFARPGDYNSRLLLLVDGVVTNDPVFGSAYVGTEFAFDLGSAERIEIVRGPASAVYGTGAMFGVVNVVLRNGGNFDGTRVTAEGGNFGYVRGSALWGTTWGNGWSAMVSGQMQRERGEDYYFSAFDAPGTNGGMARGLDGDRSASVLGQIRYRGFSMHAGISSRTKDVPTAPFGVAFGDPRTQTTDQLGFLSLEGETPLSPTSTLSSRAYYGGVDYRGQYPYDQMNDDASSGRAFGAELVAHWDLPFGARLTAGAEFRRIARASYSSWTGPVVYSNRDAPSSIYSGFGEGELQVADQVRFVAGLRLDEYSDYAPSLSPRIALVCTPSVTTTVKILYGEAYRVPNFYEANYDDPVGGYRSNPTLNPERIHTVEAVCDQRMTRDLSASVSVYRYSMSNLIDQGTAPGDSLSSFFNRGAVTATGVEASVQAVGRGGLRGRMSYCYEHSVEKETQALLTNSPAHIIRCSLGGPIASWLEVSGFIMYESPRLTLSGPWTAGGWTADADVALTPVSFPATIELRIRNLFDARILAPAGPEHLQASLVQFGRVWSLGVSIAF